MEKVFGDTEILSGHLSRFQIHFLTSHSIQNITYNQIYFVGLSKKRSFFLSHTNYHSFFITRFPFLSSQFLTSLRSCNGHAPLIIQEGRARAGLRPSRVEWGKVPHLTVSSHSEIGGGGGWVINCDFLVGFSHSLLLFLLQCPFHFMMSHSLSHPVFLTSLRSCYGHAPLIIQEGRARAGLRPSRAEWGRIPHSTVTSHSKNSGGGTTNGHLVVYRTR
jgi:hypothetical protein